MSQRPVRPAQVGIYLHTQTTPSTEWIINHNLNKKPRVDILDDTGDPIHTTVRHVDDNTLRILFKQAKSGEAILS